MIVLHFLLLQWFHLSGFIGADVAVSHRVDNTATGLCARNLEKWHTAKTFLSVSKWVGEYVNETGKCLDYFPWHIKYVHLLGKSNNSY